MRRHTYYFLFFALTLLSATNAWAIPPAITTQPTDKTACVAATNVKFSVAATNATSYQWQVDDGNGFVNITNGGVYAFATTAVLTLNGVTTAMNNYRFRCIASGPDNPPATSNPATLTVNDVITITTNTPATLTMCQGTSSSLSVAATGTITSYQWYGYTGSSYVAITNTGFYTGANTATLNINNIAPMAGAYTAYYCDITGPCAYRRTNITYLTINSLPAVLAQPADRTVCPGYQTSFSISAAGSGISYQWQVSYNNGTTWNNLANNASFSGVNTSQLLVNVTSGLNNSTYRCVVSGTCTPPATSNAARLTVTLPLEITVQPQDKNICEGIYTTMYVSTTGTVGSYKWQIFGNSGWTDLNDGGIYSGTSTRTLAITGATMAANGTQYRCVIADGACAGGGKSSEPATLTVKPTTIITAQPTAIAPICSGGNASYTTTATGHNLTYQWQMYDGTQFVNMSNGGFYSGVTSATLNITGITAATTTETNLYRCIVTGTCNTVSSNPVTLTVHAKPAVTSQPADVTTCQAFTVQFSIAATGTNPTYQWQVSYNNGTTWNVMTNNASFSGVTTSQLSVNAVPSLNNSTYRCVVSGTCTPPAISNAARLTVNQPVTITVQPTDKDVCAGVYTTFYISATGSAISYQWQHFSAQTGWTNLSNTGVYSGTNTRVLSLTGVSDSLNNHIYRCIVNDGSCPGGTKISDVCSLKVKSTIITTQPPANDTVCAGSNKSLSVGTSGTVNSYQWYGYNGSSYVAITNTGYYTGANTSTLNITGIMPGAGAYTAYYCVVYGPCVQKTSSLTYLTIKTPAAITSQPTNKTVCEGFNVNFTFTATGTNLSYQWQIANPMDSTGWSNIMNDSVYSNVTSSSLKILTNTSLNGKSYRCVISGGCAGTVITNAVVLTVNSNTMITMQPQNVTLCSSTTASYSVTATGTGLTYKWQMYNGSAWVDINNDTTHYSNDTTTTLNIMNIDSSMNNMLYRCVVSGTCVSTVYSNSAHLKIGGATITSDPTSHTVTAGTNTTFFVTATGVGLQYQWQGNTGSGWANLVNGGNYSNVTSAVLSISGTPLSFNSYQYRCIATDSCNMDTSLAATLLVSPADTSMMAMTRYKQNGVASTQAGEVSTSGIAAKNNLVMTEVKLYPNPNNGKFVVAGTYANGAETAKIAVVNTLGQVIYTANAIIQSGRLYHEIDMNGRVTPGIYVIHIDVNNQPVTMQFNIAQ